jgi:lipopolysaccharide transport system ATP-binding protein
VLAVGIKRHDGTPVYGVSSELDGVAAGPQSANMSFRFSIRYPELALLPGTYTIALHAMDPEAIRLFDTVERTMVVTGRSREVGLVQLPHQLAYAVTTVVVPVYDAAAATAACLADVARSIAAEAPQCS